MTTHNATVTLSFDPENERIDVQWSFSHLEIAVGDSLTMTVGIASGSDSYLSNPLFAQITFRDTFLGIPFGETITAWPYGQVGEMAFFPYLGQAASISVSYGTGFRSDRRIRFTAYGTVTGPIAVWHGDPELTLKAGTPPEDPILD